MHDAIQKTLADLVDVFNANGVRFAVIGGLAASVRGEPRFTADVDVVIAMDIDEALNLVEALRKTVFRPLFSDVADVVRTAFLLPLRHQETKIKVDVALGLTGFERQAIDRATPRELGTSSPPVVTAEDLILMKLLASRPRDIDDIAKVVSRQGAALDWAYLLETGRQLQNATESDLLSSLRRLQSGPTS